MNHSSVKKGFGVIGVLIALAIIVVVAGGAYFFNTDSASKASVGREAMKQAENITEVVREQNERTIEATGDRLDLSNQGLTSVPRYVFSMTNIQELNLSNNKLTGALPGEIRQLKNLRVLNVSHNTMTGIPAEIGQLNQLETLNYANNKITGLPHELANLINLRLFDLTGNSFSKQDLEIITKNLPNLKVVY